MPDAYIPGKMQGWEPSGDVLKSIQGHQADGDGIHLVM